MKHYVFDIEVFRYGWLVSFKDTKTGEFTDFINTHASETTDSWLRVWMENQEMVLCGFNNKHYDNYILKAIYHQFDCDEIKMLNDFIIGGGQGWEWPKWNFHKQPFEAYDIRDDLPITLSLKEIEGNMGLPIVESPIPFDLDRPLTSEEWDEVVKYCHWDIDATDKLRKERQAYLDSKAYVGKLAGLTKVQALGMTNAKLTAAYLAGLNAKPIDRHDELEYKLPDNLELENKQVLSFFEEIDPTYERKETVLIAGVEHTLAYGGLHGARSNYIGKTEPGERYLVNADVVSYYPSLMIKNNYVSRAVPNPEDYEKVFTDRIEAKRSGDKEKADALKLVLNTTYGAMKNQYNPLYDPLMANSVCISGQLYLIDLIEKLQRLASFELVQSNTDGILFAIGESDKASVLDVVEKWEKRTGFKMEYDDVDVIYQKDVNNYVLRNKGGKVKVKGGYVSNYEGGGVNNASIPIVAKAIVEYLLNGEPVEDTITIRQNESIIDFQMIAKTGRTYDKTVHEIDGALIEVQRVNRVYATHDERYGTIYKVKESENRKDKIANLPDHCVIDNDNKLKLNDIDLLFYINMANKRIEDFIGDQPTKDKKKKEEKPITKTTKKKNEEPAGVRYFYHPESESYWFASPPINYNDIDVELSIEITKEEYDEGMRTSETIYELRGIEPKKEESKVTTTAEKKTTPTKASAPLTLAQKLFELRKVLSSFIWEKDGKNLQQKYKYISEAQYKKYFEKALEQCELDFFTDVIESQFIPSITDKMHLTTIKVEYTIIDPVSGEGRVYQAYGQGADMHDKGYYKAVTGALKYFINSNFLINDNSDPENDEEDVKPTNKRPAAPEKREEIKKEIMSKDEPVTDAQKARIKELRDALKEAGGHEDVVKKVNATMKAGPTKVQANALIMELDELVDGLEDDDDE